MAITLDGTDGVTTTGLTSNGIDDNATSTAITIDASENVGIGLTPSAWSTGKAVELGFQGNALWGNAADEIIVSQNAYYNSGWKYATSRVATSYSQYNGVHRWFTAPYGTADGALTWSESMRLDASGVLLVGTTVTTDVFSSGSGNEGAYIKSWGQIGLATSNDISLIINRKTVSGSLTEFRYNGAVVGSISTNGSSTSYNTSSDYRLKENVVTLDNATDRLKQIPVHRFNFIADADTTVDGFLAHEVQTVVPEAITGTKDEVNDEGNPVYQGIDQSKLVPLLVATVKELEARIATLEAN